MSYRTTSRHTSLGTLGALAIGAALAACSSPTEIDATTGAGTALAVTHFELVGSSWMGNTSDGTAPVRTVVRDEGMWTAFWKSLPTAGAPTPAVNFSTTMVIVAASATRPTGGYSVKVERVTEHADYLEATVVERKPGAGCLTTQALTRPFDVAQVPRRDKPVRFSVSEVTYTCGAPTTGDSAVARVTVGQTVAALGAQITLRKVESDSRCPMNAMCIWEGDAAATFRLEANGASSEVTLHTNGRAGGVTATVGGREFRFAALTPYPVAGQAPPAANAYTATVVVR